MLPAATPARASTIERPDVHRISRRTALKSALLGGAAALGATSAVAASGARPQPPADAVGLLYDATLCIGCKACVVACKDANGLPAETSGPRGLYDRPDDLSSKTKNIIKLYRSEGEQSFIKRQCMHCLDPACVGACMIGALEKREHGIVSWEGNKCVGCRYCQVACPFGIPKFEWTTAGSLYNPRIVKCELCRERLAEGREPACTEVCPRQAVIYGRREALLAEAKRRIAASPDRYVPHVYGETEAGGTQVLYLSHVPFDRVGLPALSDDSLPAAVHRVQGAIYKGFVAPVALYGILAVAIARNQRPTAAADEAEHGS
jgi:Fe-S-cluster-containing dehydrogenase component